MQDVIVVDKGNNPHLSRRKNPYAAIRTYDVRGIYPDELDAEIAYKVTKAFIKMSPGKRYVIGQDMRRSSPILAAAIMQAIQEENLEVDSIGQTTTDHLYYTVGAGGYAGGAMITASHNASQFNGIKFVKKGVVPASMMDLKESFKEIEDELHYLPLNNVTPNKNIDNKSEFIQHILKVANVKTLRKMKVVVDAGNGMAGTLVKDLFRHHHDIDLIPMYFEPHPDFPHHEANPAVPTNILALQEKVKKERADLGVAFDGDGDRVFFVDENGEFVEGYYILSLLSEYFLSTNKGATIVYDLKNVKALESIVRVTGGRGIVSKTGHLFIKQKMRQEEALFGGESSSAHYYFGENFYADSGAIALEIVLKLMSETDSKISELVKTYKERFFISGEKNFHMKDMARFPDLVKRLKSEFPDGTISDFDGLVIDFPDWRFSLRPSGTEPFVRLNVESEDKSLLGEKQAALFNIIEEYAQYTGFVSNIYGLKTLNLDKKEKLEFLFSNLYFSWNQYKANYLDNLYGTQWARNQTPLDVLRSIDPPILDSFYEKNKYNIEESIRLQQTYLNNETWFQSLTNNDKLLARLNSEPVAYFSLEFGLVDWLQIYSGGLGVLAGDTIKEASDSGLPMVGVGLFYAEGYFYQRFTEDGWQLEDYLAQDTDDYPMELIRDQNGYTVTVDVKLGEKIIKIRGWRVKVGRRSLILLDTNFKENDDWEDRMITYHLYGGKQDTRIKQEILLGIGGYKFLRQIGINPSILHLNEGHSAFAIIARTQEIMSQEGLSFEKAVEKARKNILFTNHTLKQAGNDVFPYHLVEQYLKVYAQDMGVEFRHIFSLGVDSIYAQGKFGMTILGLRNAEMINAVSKIHADAAKKVWPDHNLIPVTNGVHLSTWVAEPIHNLLDSYVGERWDDQGESVDWDKVQNIDNTELWSAHNTAKALLLKHLKENTGVDIPEDSLIFAWFRRITQYKQPEILMLDLERLNRIINESGHNVRFVFGGKAHPQDSIGKEILKQIYQVTQQPRFKDKLILVPDYNWRMARYMVSGADVWVNSPIRFQEACGTSGMKAGANGLLQFSTIDGWIDEIKDKDVVWEIKDNLDVEQYYSQIEKYILPMFFERNASGLPEQWLQRMKDTMKVVLAHYGSDRMIREYIEKLYRPILKENLLT